MKMSVVYFIIPIHKTLCMVCIINYYIMQTYTRFKIMFDVT